MQRGEGIGEGAGSRRIAVGGFGLPPTPAGRPDDESPIVMGDQGEKEASKGNLRSPRPILFRMGGWRLLSHALLWMISTAAPAE